MAWVGTITWTNLLVRLRALISEPIAAWSDENMMAACNAAILSVRGELVIPNVKAVLDVTTGTFNYTVPADFVAIDYILDSAKKPIPDYAWYMVPGNDAEIVFRAPYFTPTTEQDPTIYGWKVQPEVSAEGDYISIDLGYTIAQTLANAHASLGGTGSQLAAWHEREHQLRTAEAEQRLKDDFVLLNFRPSPTARLVPGRTQGQGT